MNRSLWAPVLALLVPATLARAEDNLDSDSPPARFEVITPASEIPVAPPDNGGPWLQSVTARKNVKGGLRAFDLVPDFHFVAPHGNAVVLRRELVDTSGAIAQTQIANATINIPAQAQQRGATISGGWRCGTQVYYVTLRASVMDADGNRSNAITYTLHCNGG